MLAQMPILSKDWYFFMGKYKKFSETRAETIILDEWVEMTWVGAAIPYYESMGYEYTGFKEKFMCHIDDLSVKSSVKVNIKCPVCGEERYVAYNNARQRGNTLCKSCSMTIDIEGLKFGRWAVVSYAGTSNAGAMWWCECDCGEVKTVSTNGLTTGDSTSCGCYVREVAKSRTGKRCYFWNGGSNKLTCENCGSSYYKRKSHSDGSRFCSATCASQWFSGERHPRYNPNISDEERQKGRWYNEGYANFIQNVLRRDEYTCQCCGKHEKDMEVHHLFSYSFYPEYATDENYAVTLCQQCHYGFHRFMGGTKVICTPSDFDRWLYTIS